MGWAGVPGHAKRLDDFASLSLELLPGEARKMESTREKIEPFVEARTVSRSFDDGRIQALRGISFAVDRGEFVGIVGPSGSGKSTLLQIIGGLDRPTSGEILVGGDSLNKHPNLAGFRSRCVGFVFQSFHLLPTLSALENVQIPMFEMDWPARERRIRAQDLLNRVGLSDRLHQLPGKLSGGERQRVAIARSLANDPALLLADEPTGNLDSETAGVIIDLLKTIHQERGMTCLVVTHDAAVASMTARQVRLLDGHLVEDPVQKRA
jgi:ABC-type lipoprotein export system ATPase subunit